MILHYILHILPLTEVTVVCHNCLIFMWRPFVFKIQNIYLQIYIDGGVRSVVDQMKVKNISQAFLNM